MYAQIGMPFSHFSVDEIPPILYSLDEICLLSLAFPLSWKYQRIPNSPRLAPSVSTVAL